MQISRDTRESLIFLVGLFGVVSQGIIWAATGRVSIPLCLVFLTMAGVVGVPALLGAILPTPPEERRRADGDPPHE